MTDARWYGWIVDRWDALRGSFWFFPAQMAALSGVLALAAIELDRRLPAEWGESLPSLTKLSAEGARSVLTTIAGSMMTVTSVVFSITVVALTLTSSQFGPRLLRTFFRDRGSQIALGTFLATFCYSLLVLRAVETPERVPYVATAGAVTLAVTSLFVLIFFVHHAASSIQASSVVAAVAGEIDDQIPLLFPEAIGSEAATQPDAADQERIERLDAEGREVLPAADGYVRVLDDDRILVLARERGLLIRVVARPGDFVTTRSPVARVLATDPRAAADADGGAHDADVAACWRLGDHRTPVHDLFFLTDQLSEMAVRALSPGVNDPNTAVACVHRLSSVLVQLCDRAMPSGLRYDGDGALRVVAEATRFEAIVASCFDPIRRYGGHDVQVVVAMLEALATGARPCSQPDRLSLLAEHAREIHDAFSTAHGDGSKRDLAHVDAVFQRVSARIEGRSVVS